ncbi:MAG: outer membrane protein transport protein, partial [Hyphomicrobium sp.]
MRFGHMSFKAALLGSIAGTAMLATATASMAGGFEVREQSAHFQGMSFAGAASGGALSSMFWNSAAAISAGPGLTFDSSYSLIIPQSDLTVTGLGAPNTFLPGTGALDRTIEIGELAIVPATYAALRTSASTVFAIGMNSQFGLGTRPDNEASVASVHTGPAKLFSINLNPTVAHTIMPGVTVGVGMMFEYFDLQRFRTSTAPGREPNAKLNGSDIGVGGTAGILLQPAAGTTIGLGYRSTISHSLEGKIRSPGLNAPIDAHLNTPDKVTLSLSQALSPSMRAHATVEWTNWSRLGVIPITLEAAPTVTISNLDFQWKDGWYYAIGGEYDVSPALTVRAGVAYETSPIDRPSARLLQLPDNDRIWASLGASYK